MLFINSTAHMTDHEPMQLISNQLHLVVEKIIIKENIDAILPTVGDKLHLIAHYNLTKSGVLKKHGVILIGAQPEAIEKAEDRQLFNDAMANVTLT